MKHKVIIYSGGMDSYTLLHHINNRSILAARQMGVPVASEIRMHALSFFYGQRHSRELDCARAECKQLYIRHHVFDLAFLRPYLTGSALTDAIAMPEGPYDGENMRLTVVPGRNTMMLSIALAFAEGLVLADERANPAAKRPSSAQIYYGAHAGDHHIYPDCRPEYIDALARTLFLASDGRVELKVPFMHIDKAGILELGLREGLDYRNTWTCYKGGDKPCGVCGSCDERAEAFAKNNVIDPIIS